jgi:hypothetical protein
MVSLYIYIINKEEAAYRTPHSCLEVAQHRELNCCEKVVVNDIDIIKTCYINFNMEKELQTNINDIFLHDICC